MSLEEFKRLQNIYKKILLTPRGISCASLAETYNLDRAALERFINDLSNKGLVEIDEGMVIPVSWWEQDHLELYFDIPYVEDNVFYEYCTELDDLAAALQRNGIRAIRPLSSEFTIDVLLGVVAGLTIAELLKGFFAKAGSDIATFVSQAIRRHKRAGVEKVVIEVRTALKEGSLSNLTFKIEGKNSQEVLKEVEVLISSLQKQQLTKPGSPECERDK